MLPLARLPNMVETLNGQDGSKGIPSPLYISRHKFHNNTTLVKNNFVFSDIPTRTNDNITSHTSITSLTTYNITSFTNNATFIENDDH